MSVPVKKELVEVWKSLVPPMSQISRLNVCPEILVLARFMSARKVGAGVSGSSFLRYFDNSVVLPVEVCPQAKTFSECFLGTFFGVVGFIFIFCSEISKFFRIFEARARWGKLIISVLLNLIIF